VVIKTSQQAFTVIAIVSLLLSCNNKNGIDQTNVLILSGKNNHEWQKTTPLLARIYKESGLFKVTITESPDTLSYNDLIKFDVIVSNWNTWPENDLRLSEKWESDFLKYVNEGGGVVSLHAGASSFYSWNEYHRIGIGRWGKETKHGKAQTGKVEGFDQAHPITKGFRDFYITDELWESTEIFPGLTALASVSAYDETDGHRINSPAVFVNQTGKGRSFYTILGHDERALLNSGLQSLVIRATQWTAKKEVTYMLPSDFIDKTAEEKTNLSWDRSDSTFSLLSNNNIIWRFNFNNRFGKPYFHPVSVNNSILTCVNPPDHPWHLGLWFSWKFINGVNYWEYLNDFKTDETGYKSAGVTEIQKISTIKNPDFSADIRMELQYHPADGDAIMKEERNLHISPPLSDGSYYIDNDFKFEPLSDEIILDRTPIVGEPDGQSWGGYSGISVRFSQNFTYPLIIVPADSQNYRKNNWLYMGFRTLTGDNAGIAILPDVNNSTPTMSWYIFNDPQIPFFYYSPAVLYDGKIILKKGETLRLKYRVWVLSGKTGISSLNTKYTQYMN